MPRKPSAPKPKPLLTRPEVIGLSKRFLKDGAYDGARDLMVMYRLLKAYPNRDFWLNRELPFKLNALFWFLGKDGKDWLQSEWDLFNLNLAPPLIPTLESTKVGEDVKIDTKPRTIAELLK